MPEQLPKTQIFTQERLGIVGEYPRLSQGKFLYGGFPVSLEALTASGWVPTADPGYRGYPPSLGGRYSG